MTFTMGKHLVVLATSLFGSYLFTRGLTLVFYEGYPSEAEIYADIKNGETVELDWHFWLYLACFVVTFIATSYWQFTREEEHEDMKNHDGFKKVSH